MIVRYVGETRNMELTKGREYSVLSVERGWYRIETDKLGDYLYPARLFEPVEEQPERRSQ